MTYSSHPTRHAPVIPGRNDTATTPMQAIRQMADIFKTYRAREPKNAILYAFKAMLRAAEALKTEPYLYMKAAVLVAQLERHPTNSDQLFSTNQKAALAARLLRLAYDAPFNERIFTPAPDFLAKDTGTLLKLAGDSGMRSLGLLVYGINARHFNSGHDPIAAEYAMRHQQPPVHTEPAAAATPPAAPPKPTPPARATITVSLRNAAAARRINRHLGRN